MKLCRDCQHFTPARAVKTGDGRTGWSPDWCGKKIGPIDPVNGHQDRVGDPRAARADEEKCGPSGEWFVPANLDGRLAVLYEKTEKGEPPCDDAKT